MYANEIETNMYDNERKNEFIMKVEKNVIIWFEMNMTINLEWMWNFIMKVEIV
jgi:hypothetical protein